MAAAAAQDQIDDAAERVASHLLLGDGVLEVSAVGVGGEASRGRVCDPRRHDEAGRVPGHLGRLQDRSARAMVGQHRDGAVVRLEAAREGRRASGRVGDQGGSRAGPRRADQMPIHDQRVPGPGAVPELFERPRQRQTRRAHAIRDHEDEIPLARRRIAAAAAPWLAMSSLLCDDGDDDDGDRREQGPHEEPDLPPELPAMSSTGRCPGSLSCEQRILFDAGSIVQVFARGTRRREQRLGHRFNGPPPVRGNEIASLGREGREEGKPRRNRAGSPFPADGEPKHDLNQKQKQEPQKRRSKQWRAGEYFVLVGKSNDAGEHATMRRGRRMTDDEHAVRAYGSTVGGHVGG